MADKLDGQIERKLHEAWRQQRRFIHVRGAGRVLVWLLALLLADFLIDWFILRGSAGRGFGLLLLLINVAILAWVVWHEWLRHLKPFNPLIAALDVESKNPRLSSLLVSYTQLQQPADDQPNVSAELVIAMREQAVVESQKIDFREIVDFGQLKNLFLVTGSVVLFFLAISINWREHFGTLFQRLAGVNAAYPTKTQVSGVPGDLTVRFGDAAPISAEAAGVIPAAGQIFTRPADGGGGDWKALPMARKSGGNTFHRELQELVGDLEYYVKIGDDKSGTHRIKVIPAPRVVGKKVTLNYPEYIARAPLEETELTFEAPEGTDVEWELTCEPAVKGLTVITGDGEEIRADITGGGKVASFAMKVDSALTYTFHWTEGASGQDFEYDDVQHSIRVVADSVPEVELLRPISDGPATVAKTIHLRVRATDDYGLGKAELVYLVNGSAEGRKPLHDFEGAAAGTFDAFWKPADDIAELKPDMEISFAVEINDRYPVAGAHLRRSPTRQISIVDTDRYLQWYRSQLAAQQDEIKRARDSEIAAAAQVKLLREQEDENP